MFFVTRAIGYWRLLGEQLGITDSAQTSLRKRATVGSVWTIFSFGTTQVLRLVGNIVLARLLFPDAFGLMSLVTTYLQLLEMLSDLGVGPTIIQNKRGDDPLFLNTAWTLQILRGSALWIFTLAMTYPLAVFYRQEMLIYMLPVAGVNSLLNGLQSTSFYTRNRHLKLGRVSIIKIGAQLSGLVITIVWALISPSVWALLAGALGSTAVRVILTHVVLTGPPCRFRWDPEARKALFDFGRWIFLNSMLGCLSLQIDRMLLARMITAEVFGVYWIAYSLSDVLRNLMNQWNIAVVFPAVARRAHLPREELRAKLLKGIQLRLAVMAVAFSLLTVFSDVLVGLLYDERYHAAKWMAPVFALGLWPRALASTVAPGLMGIGKPQFHTYGSAARIVFILVALPLSFHQWGLVGAVITVAMADLPRYLIMCYGLRREGLLSMRKDLIGTVNFILILAAMVAIRVALGFGTPFQNVPWHEAVGG